MAQPLAGHFDCLCIVTCSHLAEDQLFVPPSMGTSQRPCFNCGGDILPHQAEHAVPCAYCAAPLHHNCERPHVLKEHPSRPVPSCGLPPQPWAPRECGPGDREQQRQVNSGCLVGGTYFIKDDGPSRREGPATRDGSPPGRCEADAARVGSRRWCSAVGDCGQAGEAPDLPVRGDGTRVACGRWGA